jgi:uncharacterized protein (DUF433 family)
MKKRTSTNARWQLYGGRDPREIPTYGTAEAARYLRFPLRTVQNWAFGFGSYGGHPLIRVADRERGLLSFWNVAELHVLGSLRRFHGVSPLRLRRALQYLGDHLNSPHPLLTERMLTDGVSIFVDKMDGLINASKGGQMALRVLMEAHLHRIDQDVDGLAIRLYPFVRRSPDTLVSSVALLSEPKFISLDPRVRFGRPVIAGTSIPTEEIAERFQAGDSVVSLAAEYGRPEPEIEEAIRCEREIRRAA